MHLAEDNDHELSVDGTFYTCRTNYTWNSSSPSATVTRSISESTIQTKFCVLHQQQVLIQPTTSTQELPLLNFYSSHQPSTPMRNLRRCSTNVERLLWHAREVIYTNIGNFQAQPVLGSRRIRLTVHSLCTEGLILGLGQISLLLTIMVPPADGKLVIPFQLTLYCSKPSVPPLPLEHVQARVDHLNLVVEIRERLLVSGQAPCIAHLGQNVCAFLENLFVSYKSLFAYK